MLSFFFPAIGPFNRLRKGNKKQFEKLEKNGREEYSSNHFYEWMEHRRHHDDLSNLPSWIIIIMCQFLTFLHPFIISALFSSSIAGWNSFPGLLNDGISSNKQKLYRFMSDACRSTHKSISLCVWPYIHIYVSHDICLWLSKSISIKIHNHLTPFKDSIWLHFTTFDDILQFYK